MVLFVKGFLLVGVVHVKDTTSLTLRDEIFNVLSHHELVIQNIQD